MTKSELLEALKDWPEDAKVEVSVPIDISRPLSGNRRWFRIAEVEQIIEKSDNEHCLLYVGNIMMTQDRK